MENQVKSPASFNGLKKTIKAANTIGGHISITITFSDWQLIMQAAKEYGGEFNIIPKNKFENDYSIFVAYIRVENVTVSLIRSMTDVQFYLQSDVWKSDRLIFDAGTKFTLIDDNYLV